MAEVAHGRAHFTITRGLKGADEVILNTAPRFFDLTIGAHADLTVLGVARLFDRRPGTVSIHGLLSLALDQAGTFGYGTPNEVRKAVADAKTRIARIEPILKFLRNRRNETMAHLDPRPVVDPDGYVRQGHVSYRQIEGLFEQAGLILNSLFQLYRGTTIALDLIDASDYEQALDLIADAKCEQARRYESDHKLPAPFPRPKKCSE